MSAAPSEPAPGCSLCPRLADFRASIRADNPDWFNGAVASFGDEGGRLLIVGLAPGLRGANRTGRPFTGDYAGDLLYKTLIDFGYATGAYAASPDDGVRLEDCLITNAVRCVPPQNKPTPDEIRTCRAFLSARIDALANLRAILALGRIAHESVIRALGEKPSRFKFAHGAVHEIDGLALHDSYHCSRYNTNTRRLTEEMFRDVFSDIAETLAA